MTGCIYITVLLIVSVPIVWVCIANSGPSQIVLELMEHYRKKQEFWNRLNAYGKGNWR